MHDEAAVDVQDPLAHVDVLLQEEPDIVGRFQEENVGGVGDERLTRRATSFTVCPQCRAKAIMTDAGLPAVSSVLQLEHCIPAVHCL